ncbi:MAG: hypothetical protein J2P45_24610 [Candidatus Dormibacteraeota bacterium]|nr:hypothetical protein [Candidatus Dormibacteraeota bacterium]
MIVSRADDLQPLYRTMLGLGAAAVLVLAFGLVFFLHVAPPGQSTGLKARVQGVYAYDPSSGATRGSATSTFAPDQPFAAAVAWSSLPSGVEVGAHWYNSFEQQLGGVGPEAAGSLAGRRALVPVQAGGRTAANAPGEYTVVVARYSQHQPVELLGRASVLVKESG